VTVALSVIIRPQFAIECLRLSNQQGVGHFEPKFPGVPIGVDPLMFGSAESEHPKLTKIVKLFRKNSNLCDRNPPTSQTDRRHAIARPRFVRASCSKKLVKARYNELVTLFFS